ncbi:transmembrane prolyl 4-hydroxylase-like isoform X2 [Montipora foliosa]|uniref:transmembrane prolyl 4-hydroxylase-like isoform X1 n=1 Tax=Montipora foliosa TaxID=591990 RepID=UPI0035F135E1
MILFSLFLISYLPSFIFDLFAQCANAHFDPKRESYNVCRFTRGVENCDYEKYDSHGDEPCMVGRKAGLTRIDGVKVGHVEDVDLGDVTRKRITRAMKPPVFEIPNFLSDEECDHIVQLAKGAGLISSVARGGLQSNEEFRIPAIRYGTAEGMAGYFEGFDLDKNERVTLKEVAAFAKKYHFLVLTEEETLQLLHDSNITELDDGFATRDEFEKMNSLGLSDAMYATVLSHPRHKSRFSEQTWVNQRGLGDPILENMVQRVVELTRLPREIIYGSEHLQVVYYGEYGHYHAHFDSETHERTDTMCCHLLEDVKQAFLKGKGCRLCRYITILYYLNDVEEGGETAFPVADNATLDMARMAATRSKFDYYNLSHNCHKGNLVVSPRKGTAIMWYNHFLDEESGWMGPRDEYSLHGGCDIRKGEKWIANNWITAPYKDSAHIASSWLRKFDVI